MLQYKKPHIKVNQQDSTSAELLRRRGALRSRRCGRVLPHRGRRWAGDPVAIGGSHEKCGSALQIKWLNNGYMFMVSFLTP